MFQTISIAAPGLLGASLAMAAHERRLAANIHVYARRQSAVDALREQPWCQLASTDLAEATRDADLIVLCAPVDHIISLTEKIAPRLTRNPIVTDVGSVKAEIVSRCQNALSGKARFVGSHPMAGSEKTGMENADASLFEGRSCFVTPDPLSDPEAVAATKSFWEALGSVIIDKTAEEHDQIVAQVSHLPHLLASTLASFLAERCPQADIYCGNGLRDTTRVAAGSPELWREIISQNRQQVLDALADFQDHLDSIAQTIQENSDQDLLAQLSKAKAFRDQL